MHRRAIIGTAVFLVLAPGTVDGLLPWWLTGWRMRPALPVWLPARLLGILLIAAGCAVLLAAFVRFAIEGLGTPAPVAPPTRLVIGGLYRYVRNPMYLAVVTVIIGQALLLWQPILVGYAMVALAAMVAFVLEYEQPALRRQFGDEYEAYRRAVPGWWPRRRPFNPEPNTVHKGQ